MQLSKRLADIYQSNTARIVAWVVAWIVVVLIVVVVFSVYFWCWLVADESGSTTIRNLGLVVAAMIGLPFVIWRSIVADRQAATAQRQSETAQSGLLNERYQKGAEMLGSEVLAVRLGGIYALDRLAREYPGDYHVQIMSLLCAFVRNPTGKPVEATLPINGLTADAELKAGWDEAGDEAGDDRPLRVREDVQAIMTAVGDRREEQIEIEREKEYMLDLSGADLKYVRLVDVNMDNVVLFKADLAEAVLVGAKLTGSKLTGANLAGANLDSADLKSVRLINVNLEGANLTGADLKSMLLFDVNLEGAFLLDADLTGTSIKRCKGLTQEQIDQAIADPDNPPDLKGVVDPQTGVLLVWRVLDAKQD